MAFRTTHLSALSVGIDPLRPTGPLGRTADGLLSVGTQNFAGIKRISSATQALGSVTVGAASSVTTFSAPGVELNDYVDVCPTSLLSTGIHFTSWVSAADVIAVSLNQSSVTAVLAPFVVRWRGEAY